MNNTYDDLDMATLTNRFSLEYDIVDVSLKDYFSFGSYLCISLE